MNFEILDNLLQIILLGGTSVLAAAFALRRKSHRCLTLSLAYACFCMGTLYYWLYLSIIGTVPQVFYVSEISWLGAYLLFLSVQFLRMEGERYRFCLPAALCAGGIGLAVMVIRIFGPSWFMTSCFALTAGAICYGCVFRLLRKREHWQMDGEMLLCVVLQVTLYAVSVFIKDYTRFSLYFAVDFLLTASLISLLPLCLREEGKT